ncbi:uncharacterized protein LOC132721456 [Ruditapes philippinarum]|uniref:uncharacterized protein LOC132721456 n=1 Tax=Ruditapes philippinarum TaxID=129788 RepID=UPI00295B1A28|nr:uncharacterized protein LOC132721456 [Ruditapes philippinarum]
MSSPSPNKLLNLAQQGLAQQLMYGSPTSTQPPAWTIDLIEEVKALKISSQKVESTLNQLTIKVSDVEIELSGLTKQVNDIETSCKFLHQDVEQHMRDINLLKDEQSNIKKWNADIEKQNFELENLQLDLQTRSMNDNLIFHGIAETPSPLVNNSAPVEDCRALVNELISDKLSIDSTSINLPKVHRLGADRAKKPQPIVAKFGNPDERETIRKKSFDKDVKEKLKTARQGVGVQRPQVNRDARKMFGDLIDGYEQAGKTVRQQERTLYVNGKLTKVYMNNKVIDPPAFMMTVEN